MGLTNIVKKDGRKTLLCRTSGVCAHTIQVVLDDNDCIYDLIFVGGCDGNAKAVKRLTLGMNVKEVAEKLNGVMCSNKGTSCTDQLSQCLIEYLNKK